MVRKRLQAHNRAYNSFESATRSKCRIDTIILFFHSCTSKIALHLRMCTNRTYFRCFCSNYDMSTTTFPYFHFTFFKIPVKFHILKKCTVSFFMMLLNLSNCSEFSCKFWKTFFFCSFCKTFIHICPFVIFTFSCCSKIFLCISNSC